MTPTQSLATSPNPILTTTHTPAFVRPGVGTVTVATGGPLAWLLRAISGVPRKNGPARLAVEGGTEVDLWHRTFGTRHRTTRIKRRSNLLEEFIGPVVCTFSSADTESGGRLNLVDMAVVGRSLPARLQPTIVIAIEHEVTAVAIALPYGLGQLAYIAALTPTPAVSPTATPTAETEEL